jgi:uncharacterized protein (TIRG00374 family)
VKRWQTLLVGLAISILALYFALRGVDIGKLQLIITEGHYIWLIPVAICSPLAFVVRAFRWKTLLNERIQLKHSFNILSASYLFNSLLPMRLGEVVRAFLTTRLHPPIPMVTSLSTVIVERIMDLLSIVLIAIVTLLVAPVSQEIAFATRTSGVLALAGIGLLILFAVRPAIPRQLLASLTRTLPALKRLPLEALLERVLEGIAPLGSFKTGLPIIGWTALAWIVSTVQIYLLLFVFYDSPTMQAALLIIVLTALAVALPAVPGNVGPFEASVVVALSLSLLATPDPGGQTRAFGYAVLLHIVSVVASVALGWFGLAQEQVTVAGLFQSVQHQSAEASSNPTSLS